MPLFIFETSGGLQHDFIVARQPQVFDTIEEDKIEELCQPQSQKQNRLPSSQSGSSCAGRDCDTSIA